MAAAVEIPKKAKAAVYDKPGTLSTAITELDVPEPGPNQVLIRLTHSGVCHSDLAVMKNAWATLPAPTQAGQVGGHEGVGEIVQLGPGAEAKCKLGQRVGIKWVSGVCGTCPACLAGRDGVCFNVQISGYYTPGTFQQYTLGPADYVTPIPDAVASAEAAPMLCGGVTTYSALRKSGATPGQYVALFGAGGGLGHLAVQMGARGMGLRVIGVDHSSKAALVRESGAEAFIAFDEVPDVVEAIVQASGGLGVHAAINLTPSMPAYDQGLRCLRFGGRLVAIGIPEGDMQPIASANAQTLIFKELSILGVAVGNRQEAIECLDMMARGIVKLHYRTEKMEKLSEVFEEMERRTLQGRVVLDLS